MKIAFIGVGGIGWYKIGQSQNELCKRGFKPRLPLGYSCEIKREST